MICHFLDTAVLIGYCFKDDVWLTASGIEFGTSEKKWSSNRVKMEFEKRFRFLYSSRRDALLKTAENIKMSITGNPVSNQVVFSEIMTLLPPVRGNPQWLIGVVSSLVEISSTKMELVRDLENLLYEYSRFSMSRFATIRSWLSDTTIECWSRFTSYPDIFSKFRDAGMNNEDDNEIILDAHDLCLSIQDEIHLVTGDFKDVKNYEKVILSNTKISSIRYLGEYT